MVREGVVSGARSLRPLRLLGETSGFHDGRAGLGKPARPELVEGRGVRRDMLRQAQHERGVAQDEWVGVVGLQSVRGEEGLKSQIEGPSRTTACDAVLRDDLSACGFKASSGRTGDSFSAASPGDSHGNDVEKAGPSAKQPPIVFSEGITTWP